jgi:hypothetical protein
MGIVVAPERRRIERYQQRKCSKRSGRTRGISKGAKRQTVELNQVMLIQNSPQRAMQGSKVRIVWGRDNRQITEKQGIKDEGTASRRRAIGIKA